jgi:hypothetical protein
VNPYTDGNVLDSFSVEKESELEDLGHDITLGDDGAVYIVDAWDVVFENTRQQNNNIEKLNK